MRCKVVQRFLLEAVYPDRPPAAVRGHLDQCAACRGWYEQLLNLERRVPLLPVPSSEEARAAFLQQVLTPAEESKPARRRWQVRERALRKLSLAASLAAALLLFAIGWWVVQHMPKPGANGPSLANKPGPPSIPDLPVGTDSQEARRRAEELVRKQMAKFAKPHTANEHVATCHEAARDLFTQVETSQDRDQRRELVAAYILLVRDELLRNAPDVPDRDKEKVLRPLVDYLGRVQSDARRLADQLSANDAEPLNQLVQAAESGRLELTRLIEQASA